MFDVDTVDDWSELQFEMDRMEDLRAIELLDRDEWLEREERFNG